MGDNPASADAYLLLLPRHHFTPPNFSAPKPIRPSEAPPAERRQARDLYTFSGPSSEAPPVERPKGRDLYTFSGPSSEESPVERPAGRDLYTFSESAPWEKSSPRECVCSETPSTTEEKGFFEDLWEKKVDPLLRSLQEFFS